MKRMGFAIILISCMIFPVKGTNFTLIDNNESIADGTPGRSANLNSLLDCTDSGWGYVDLFYSYYNGFDKGVELYSPPTTPSCPPPPLLCD
ncbi:MAG: hypothetical protein INQ03_21250 [Candidatus Heimdallarchaeota archaeon]|nr:hypothetical protein [Candidatus Heimdallarchaeota archaeon]